MNTNQEKIELAISEMTEKISKAVTGTCPMCGKTLTLNDFIIFSDAYNIYYKCPEYHTICISSGNKRAIE